MGHRGEMVGEWDRLLFFKKFQSPEGSLAAERLYGSDYVLRGFIAFQSPEGSLAAERGNAGVKLKDYPDDVSIPRRVFSC